MTMPYMPLFVADYLADTRHLSAIQHGAYLLLIMNYWQTGKPLPNDDQKLARIACMSRRDWGRNRDAILEFFTVEENLLIHSRIAQELTRVEAKSLKSKRAAQASVERRFNKRSADAQPEREEKDTLAKANAIDPEKVLFDQGISYLAQSGVRESKARPIIGKWKRDHGPAAVIEALGAAQREGAIDPVSFITAALRTRAKQQGPPVWDGMP